MEDPQESSPDTRRKLSKGQRQRHNRQLRKTQSRNDRFARETAWTEINQDIRRIVAISRTVDGYAPVPNVLPTLRPRAAWMIDDDDHRTEAQADADWHETTRQLLGSSSTVHIAPLLPSPCHQTQSPTPCLPNGPDSPWAKPSIT
jgi:hypothetical protein